MAMQSHYPVEKLKHCLRLIDWKKDPGWKKREEKKMEKEFYHWENIDFLQSIQATKEPLNATPIVLTVSSYSFFPRKKKANLQNIMVKNWDLGLESALLSCRCSTDKIERFSFLRSISMYLDAQPMGIEAENKPKVCDLVVPQSRRKIIQY